jgi:hypothetical protein
VTDTEGAVANFTVATDVPIATPVVLAGFRQDTLTAARVVGFAIYPGTTYWEAAISLSSSASISYTVYYYY